MDINRIPYYLHIVGEVAGVSPDSLNYDVIDTNFRSILGEYEIKVIKSESHEFPGGGLSIVYILSASHLAIHTWPELNYMHFDLITCAPKSDFEELKSRLKNLYSGADIRVETLNYFETPKN